MEEEFTSPTVNKYSSGPGMALQSSKKMDDSNKPKYSLYVTNIPVGLTNVSCTNWIHALSHLCANVRLKIAILYLYDLTLCNLHFQAVSKLGCLFLVLHGNSCCF